MPSATETPHQVTLVVKSTTCQVRLMPWDPNSSEHVKRLIDQRIACGWKSELVPQWISPQQEGKIAIQWIVLCNDDPNAATKLKKHVAAHPTEAMPLLDTANSLIGKSRKPTNESFLPVGHIGLNTEHETPNHDEDIEGLYWISNFYVSTSLQGSGLGRAAMDAVEETAIAEPLNAKVLALSSVTRENKDHKEKWTALGREPPKITNQDWYERRGYVPYKYVNDLWWESDKAGKRWPHSAVFMKKVIA